MRRVAVDIGGTFTDLVWSENGKLVRVKSISTPDPTIGLERAIAQAGVQGEKVSLFLHATTLITNLIIQRAGAKIGFVTTQGFRDLLEIQTGLRPNPYDLQWKKPPPLVPRNLRREIRERVGPQGEVILAADPDQIEVLLRELVGLGIEALAVCLLNSYANPAHEQLIGTIARRVSSSLHVSLSCEIDPRIREYPRMSTTVANAYAMPAFNTYASTLDGKIRVPTGIKFMQSSGGVVRAPEAAKAPVNLVSSGPVGGVLGAKLVGKALGYQNIITMDIGGTSLDVCVIHEGEVDEKDELFIQWGIPIRTHTLDIHSIGAGGGSIAEVDPGGVLRVGPKSAGASPGPACYGRGGTEATVTDANLILGLIRPRVIGGGEIQLDEGPAHVAMTPIATHFRLTLQEAATGVFRTVNSNMAQAIREITVFKGVDPRDFCLMAFGGGGGQHAVEVARELGIKSVVVPPFPSVFSALGLLSADLMQTTTKTVLTPVSALDADVLERELDELETAAKSSLQGEPVIQETSVRRVAYVRYIGQSHELPVPLEKPLTGSLIYDSFEQVHHFRYGTRLGDPAEIVDLKVTAIGKVPSLELPKYRGVEGATAPDQHQTAFGLATVFARGALLPGAVVDGPALLEEPDTTIFLPSACRAEVDEYGAIRIVVG